MGQADSAQLIAGLLDLEPAGVDSYRGHNPLPVPGRAFGGQVVAQALAAATQTVEPDRPVHSLRAEFLRLGANATAFDYVVERLRDGGSFSGRRVLASQEGEAAAIVSASFHRPERWAERSPLPPPAPAPEEVEARGLLYPGPGVIADALDLRWFGDEQPGRRRLWFRALAPVADGLHACLAAYVADLFMLDNLLRAHGARWGDRALLAASLDLTIWFHRPPRTDAWLLYDTEAVTASAGRGLVKGELYSDEGDLVASVVQEVVVRPRRPRRARSQ